ncbi:MAG: lysophospholipid acyltransferase family protein [Phycisphaerales bacterium]
MSAGDGGLLPATPNPRVRRVFTWYAERMLRRRFHAIRAVRGGGAALADVAAARGPTLLVLSHSSWWDPIVASLLWRRWFAPREVVAPMDRRELERFRFMRKLGMFGIDPDDPASLAAMQAYVIERLVDAPDAVVMLTPQGRFADPREPIVVRPGAASLAAHAGIARAASVAIEYAFWNDQRPEVFLRVEPIEAPASPTTTAWQRAIAAAMRGNAQSLASAVRGRDASQFEAIVGGAARIQPVYDLWLALTGRSRAIDVGHRESASGAAR